MLITLKDIQRVGDEETLLHFLEEKLNLPIPEGATFVEIALPLPLPFLGLDKSTAEQIIDCQDFSGFSQDALGERRPFLIRFKYKSGYSEILREIAESLHQKSTNPTDLFFICADEDFKPFAFAYFNNSASGNWHVAVLNILAWTQENTHIHTSSEHKLPTGFFPNPPTNPPIVSTSPSVLLAKLENIGTPLNRDEIHIGITTGCNDVFVINEYTYKRMRDEDSKRIKLIKRLPEPNQKWRCNSVQHLIYIPSSKIWKWPWSNAKSELEAERIFAANYPAISAHLKRHKTRLKNRSIVHQGKFYWELPPKKLFSMTEESKIIYKTRSRSMQATYDDLQGFPLSGSFLIPTTDLSLLAILNSKLFGWFAQRKFQLPKIKALDFAKKNMKNAPIAPRTERQQAELSALVQQILDDPNSPKVPDIEREIDQLVYKLYELTDAEKALIEEETNP